MTDTTHELTVTRLIDAPREAVWRAWTDHGEEWLCPRPWRAEVLEMDLRSGGASRMMFHGPDGEAMPLQGVYLEVRPGERVVSTDALDPDWRPHGPFMVRVDEFADEGGGTRYTATARHWTAEARAQHEAMGFEAGWGASADQLAEVAKRLAAGGA
ncbi:SRPBCC family protein [Sphingomonas lenta]|uniref:ATPase n=1 Tax=Sphingomonas lenta TaxID=1141887 RepID=A0A2A2SFQ6_9SPHN|nr:SRPBCC family protein [Sphingomonas lenta]PAX07841.1 ATPase [Sphingomonas lenta]